jgi:isopenicillin N synthase-like dioxygenase
MSLHHLNTVDLSAYLSSSASPDEARALAEAFVQNARDVGFFYVTGYESVVSKELVDEVFSFVRPLHPVSSGSVDDW